MSIASLALAFLSGNLSTLSPCVLPLLPIVLGTAASRHRFGPVALAAGLSVSFVVIGLFVATVGFSIGLDGGVFRRVAAAVMAVIGLALVIPQLQAQFATAAGPVANWASGHLGVGESGGLWPQFATGALLGAVWSPCVGPTLGAASVLAAQGRDLAEVAAVMTMFGIGAAVPLLAIGMLSNEALRRVRGRMIEAGGRMKHLLGVTLFVVGIAILTGADKVIEARLVALSPAWLTDLTTRF